MKIEILGRNYSVSERLNRILTNKIEKLDRYFVTSPDVKVVCRKQNDIATLEITITSKGMLFRSEVSSDNMFENIDLALPKVEKQIIKYMDKKKEVFKDRKQFEELEFVDDMPVFTKKEVIKTKTFEIDPLSSEDACMMLEASGHDFYVYLDSETGKVNVVYKRKDGQYGIIKPIY